MAGIGAATVYVCAVSFSLLMLGLYIVGTARYLADLEENTCDMTYMFEYPQYVKIALDEELEERYPRYGLYAYGEGFVTQRLRRMKFSGIPVLFVPGNGGSHEQARSLASVSLRKSIKDRTPFHFDHFTVSLGKDYSALFGGVLEDETAYVSLCINRILSLYKGKVDKVVLIGHSMGGVIAKGALLRRISPDASDAGRASNASAASILVTLASPHRPIFLPDRTIARYYEELESRRRLLGETDTTVVSIGGGKRDVLVGSSQTFDASADLNLLTSGMPDVWRSTDHLCILWCKQLVLTIVRALFDCVDVNARPPAITSDSGHKLRALGYHLASRFSGKRMQPYEEKHEFKPGAEWIEDTRRQYTWTSRSGDWNKTVFLMIRLDSPSYDGLSLESTNLDAKDWLFACSAYAIEGHSRVCKWGWNLTNRTNLSPDSRRRLLHLDLRDLRDSKLSHLVARIPASDEPRGRKNAVKIHVDLYRGGDRTTRLEGAPGGSAGFLNVFRLSSILTPNPYASVAIPRGSLAHRFSLAGIADAVSVEIEFEFESESESSSSSSGGEERENPRAVLELLQEPNRRGVSARQVRPIIFKDVAGGTTGRRERAVMHLAGDRGTLMVTLGPECSYRMTVRRAGIVERVACSVRDRWPTLYPIIVALCLHGVAMRIDNSRRKTAISVGVALLVGLALDRVFEILVAMGLVHVFAVTTFCLVVFFGSVARNIAARFVARIVAMPNLWFDWLLGGLDRVPILTTFVLLSLISATCGAIAILLSVALFFLKFTRMYDEFVEELLMASLRQFIPFGRRTRRRKRRENSGATDATTAQPRLNGSTTETAATSASRSKSLRESILDTLLLFVTWSFAAIPAIPSALVWAKNFRYETRLTTEDPTMLLSWLVLTGWASLGYVDLPPSSQPDNSSKLGRPLCGATLRLASFALLCTAGLENSAHYQWIAPPIVALCVTCVALLSLFRASSTPDESPADAAQRVERVE